MASANPEVGVLGLQPFEIEAKPIHIRFNLRHTYASLLIAQGEHPKYIQSQLGHSSINVTTDIYGHLMEAVNQKAARLLGKTVLSNITTKAQSENMLYQIH
jgi:hypothetical protein